MAATTWYQQQRQAFIAEMLQIYGFINRVHLVRKFGCSEVQASIDLKQFRNSNPDSIIYNDATRRFENPDATIDEVAAVRRAYAALPEDA